MLGFYPNLKIGIDSIRKFLSIFLMSQCEGDPTLFFVADENRLFADGPVCTIPAGSLTATPRDSGDGGLITNITENPSITHQIPLGKIGTMGLTAILAVLTSSASRSLNGRMVSATIRVAKPPHSEAGWRMDCQPLFGVFFGFLRILFWWTLKTDFLSA